MNVKDRKTDQRAQDYTNLNSIMLLSTMCTEDLKAHPITRKLRKPIKPITLLSVV